METFTLGEKSIFYLKNQLGLFFSFMGRIGTNGRSHFLVWLLLYAHGHRSVLGAAGHIILTPANQLMEE
jgi:hypothetical protein